MLVYRQAWHRPKECKDADLDQTPHMAQFFVKRIK